MTAGGYLLRLQGWTGWLSKWNKIKYLKSSILQLTYLDNSSLQGQGKKEQERWSIR
jgi:hypothetical protein